MAWSGDQADVGQGESDVTAEDRNESKTGLDANSLAQSRAADSFLSEWRERNRGELPDPASADRDPETCPTDDQVQTDDQGDAGKEIQTEPEMEPESRPPTTEADEFSSGFNSPEDLQPTDAFADSAALAEFGRVDDQATENGLEFGAAYPDPALGADYGDPAYGESGFRFAGQDQEEHDELGATAGARFEPFVEQGGCECSASTEFSATGARCDGCDDCQCHEDKVGDLGDSIADPEQPEFSSLAGGSPVNTADVLADFGQGSEPNEPPATPEFEAGSAGTADKEADPWQTAIEEDSESLDDDNSLTNYMDRLMQRVRGDGPAREPAPQRLMSGEPTEPETGEPKESPGAASTLKADEFLPRHRAPEQGDSLRAMRELANDQANKAIVSHEQRNWAESAQAKRVAAYGMFVVGTLIMYFAGFASLIGYFGAFVSFGVAIYWLKQARDFAGTSRRIAKSEAQTATEPATTSGAAPTMEAAGRPSLTDLGMSGSRLDSFEGDLLKND